MFKSQIFFFFLAAPCGFTDHSAPTVDQNHTHLQWNPRVLTTGPPGNSLKIRFFKSRARNAY